MYFKNLYALRFIGAFAVILGHIEFIKSLRGVPNINHFAFYKNTNGHMGVILFFVLSGFLITYLLVNELEGTNKINLKRFYFRRIIRIWPIYYIMIILSVFIIPFFYNLFQIQNIYYSKEGIIYFLLILPNVSKALNYYYDGAVHLWSIGVEEQFYLVWPILLMIFKRNKLLLLLSIFIVVTGLPMLFWFLKSHDIFFTDSKNLFKIFISLSSQFKINSMALGGIIAVGIYYQQSWIRFIQNYIIGIPIILICLFCWINGISFGDYRDEIYSFLFAIIIAFVVNEKMTIINLEHKFFNFLGKISYGLYVYHWLIILLFINLLNYCSISNEIIYNILLYFLVISFTILVSWFSYEKIEKRFLQLKDKY